MLILLAQEVVYTNSPWIFYVRHKSGNNVKTLHWHLLILLNIPDFVLKDLLQNSFEILAMNEQ